MPAFRKHLKSCESFSIPRKICVKVNKEMDEPSQWIPGCKHREFRHHLEDCEQIARILARKAKNNIERSKIFNDAVQACKLHIKDDCKEGKEICKRSLPCRKVKNDFEFGS